MRPPRLDPGRAGQWVAHVRTVAGRHRVFVGSWRGESRRGDRVRAQSREAGVAGWVEPGDWEQWRCGGGSVGRRNLELLIVGCTGLLATGAAVQ